MSDITNEPSLNDLAATPAVAETTSVTTEPVAPAALAQPAVSEEVSVEEAPAPNPNFKQQVDYSSVGVKDFDLTLETAFMPSANFKQTEAVVNNISADSLKDNKSQDWLTAVSAGLAALPWDGGFSSVVERPEAAFEQFVTGPKGPLAGSTPPFTVSEGKKYTGESARMHVRSSLNLGTVFNVPLWHSGIWVTLKAPSEGDLLELYRQINQEKITLGRSTYGLMFSNGTSYTARLLLDFAVEHIYKTSLILKENEDIRNYIRVPDLPLLTWGLACAIWPKGFQYQRCCITEPDKCKHVLQEKLNLAKLLWTDTSCLTERQINHMANRAPATVTSESVKQYVSEFIRGQSRKIEVTDKLSIIFKVPNSNEFVDSGYRWINNIEETYGKSLTQDESTRDNYLRSQAKATAMRQFGHFVESIEVDGINYDEASIIDDMLNDLTSDDNIRDVFMEKAKEYVDDAMVSLVAIPNYKCPNCGKDQTNGKELPKHPGLIALDPNQTFFTLLVPKLRRIESR
jgi:hypothetical protein